VSSHPSQLAVDLLLATRMDDDDAAVAAIDALAQLEDAELQTGLPDDDTKLAFWIDIYNAAMQLQPGDAVGTLRGRMRVFRKSVITVAGRPLSLDAIEHGILRRSRWKLSLGYAGNPRPSAFERAHRVDRLEPRIHFALNCGAASCPPIAAYEGHRIDDQLDLATRGFLASEVLEEADTLRLPTVMLWFMGDFGGRAGVRQFLDQHGIETGDRRIRFRRYDWTPAPGRWSQDDSRQDR
jgi:hypothetical protein